MSEVNYDLQEWKTLIAEVRQGQMVHTDSRQIRKGDVFIAINGPVSNGEDFIPQAIENGAGTIISAREVDTGSTKLILHPDPRAAVGRLASAYFKNDDSKIKIVGITGTNGKTTVSYLIEQLLSQAGHKVGVLGTVSYRWPGFEMEAPLTTPGCWELHEMLAKMNDAGVDVVVMEVSSHALDQNRVAGIKFSAAVLMNLTQDHLDYHNSMEEYFEAKSLLFTSYAFEDKAKLINFDDKYGRRLLETCPDATGFGLSDAEIKNEKLQGEMISCTGQGMHLKMTYHDKSWEIESDLIGNHNGSNLLAATGVALKLGLTPEQIDVFKDFHGVPGRLERVRNDKGLDIFVDYAHTPDALENVLSTLKKLNFNRVITVFGCGGDRDSAKRPLMAAAACKYSDIAVLTSDNPRTEDPWQIIKDAHKGLDKNTTVIEEIDRSKAIKRAVKELQKGDVLLIAGKGHETYQIIGKTKRDFSDSVEVSAAIKEIYS